MAVITRDITVPKTSAAKVFSRPKAFSRIKISSKSKSVNQIKVTFKLAQRTAPTSSNAPDVPATPSPGTASPDLIEKTDIEALGNPAAIRKFI